MKNILIVLLSLLFLSACYKKKGIDLYSYEIKLTYTNGNITEIVEGFCTDKSNNSRCVMPSLNYGELFGYNCSLDGKLYIKIEGIVKEQEGFRCTYNATKTKI